MPNWLLNAEHITKRFLGVAALEDVSVQVASGEIHALLGENGAGKSTFLKILAGAHRQDEGTLEFDGRPLAHQNPSERQKQEQRTIRV
jgi:ABC-type sugar transport system ATPase subunit